MMAKESLSPVRRLTRYETIGFDLRDDPIIVIHINGNTLNSYIIKRPLEPVLISEKAVIVDPTAYKNLRPVDDRHCCVCGRDMSEKIKCFRCEQIYCSEGCRNFDVIAHSTICGAKILASSASLGTLRLPSMLTDTKLFDSKQIEKEHNNLADALIYWNHFDSKECAQNVFMARSQYELTLRYACLNPVEAFCALEILHNKKENKIFADLAHWITGP